MFGKTEHSKIYTFMFVDSMYITINKKYENKSYAVHTILGYDIKEKCYMGLCYNEGGSKHSSIDIYKLKIWGLKDILFINIDGVLGFEDGANAIF